MYLEGEYGPVAHDPHAVYPVHQPLDFQRPVRAVGDVEVEDVAGGVEGGVPLEVLGGDAGPGLVDGLLVFGYPAAEGLQDGGLFLGNRAVLPGTDAQQEVALRSSICGVL